MNTCNLGLSSCVLATVLFAVLPGMPLGAYAGSDGADWWQAQRELDNLLVSGGTNIAGLARDMSAAAPTNGQQAMYRLCVFIRSGMTNEAREALGKLKAACPGLDNYQVSSLYHDACDNLADWSLAQAVLDVFAENVTGMALDNRLIKHLLAAGWTVEKVDEWLADKPRGSGQFWVKERLRFNVQHGRGEVLMKGLADAVRTNPASIENTVAYLDALVYARSGGAVESNLAWLAETVVPRLTTEASDIASRLEQLEDWSTASSFYRRAIAIPLTSREIERLGAMCQVWLPEAKLAASFESGIRDGLARCLLRLSRKEEAQEWMVAADDIRQTNQIGRNALFAGQVQEGSGQRTIEGRIKAEEKRSENDPDYWLDRARYYRGRKDPGQEEASIKTGLALTVPQPRPDRGLKGHVDWRGRFLSEYARFLLREDRVGEAVAMLRKELEVSPAAAESSQQAARLLAFECAKQIRVEDAVLWGWLGARPKWEHVEERLLWRLLESASRDDLDRHFVRAETLASGADPIRAYTLGWIMNRMAFPKRSMPLLASAVEKAQDPELRERAAFALLESSLDVGDWQRAEAIFPVASRRLTSEEFAEWYSRIAVAAAKAGDREDAMRLWRRLADVNPAATAKVDDLVTYGLKNELIDFYRGMRKTMPSSDIPARVLATLKAD